MEETDRTCEACGRELPIGRFETTKDGWTRAQCRECVGTMRNKSVSGSYEMYLRRLLTKARSARKDTHAFEITPEDVIELWEAQQGRCAVSGVILTHHADGTGKKEFNASLDRIDSNRGYLRGNVQLVAYRVNLLKHTLSTDMLYWWVKTIHDYSCD